MVAYTGSIMNDDVALIAQRLLGTPPLLIDPVAGGGNNRIYRVTTARGTAALKGYRVADDDPRDRLGQEWSALSLIAAHAPDAVPRPLAQDRAAGWAAYEWIDGERIGARDPGDIDAAIAFLKRLQRLRSETAAAGLADASEACLSVGELRRQIEGRLARFAGQDQLASFLSEIAALAQRLTPREVGPAGDRPLSRGRQILSPSDFGFHNALRRPDGRLAFLDFEYFGWDDPAKLASDIHWHPGMGLTAEERRRFARGLAGLFGEDPGYSARLAVFQPLIGLRWCLILLNEFLPRGLARRRHAGQAEDAEAARARQLAKARALYSEVAEGL